MDKPIYDPGIPVIGNLRLRDKVVLPEKDRPGEGEVYALYPTVCGWSLDGDKSLVRVEWATSPEGEYYEATFNDRHFPLEEVELDVEHMKRRIVGSMKVLCRMAQQVDPGINHAQLFAKMHIIMLEAAVLTDQDEIHQG